MKIIILPLLRFIWALFLTIVYLSWAVPSSILIISCYTVWEFKLPDLSQLFKYKFGKYDYHVSPYSDEFEYKTFKSYLHYIWCIEK